MSTTPDDNVVEIDRTRTDEIIQFVRKNPRSTKAEVIRHMKGKSAVTTTHALINALISEGKINVYKVNVQTHLLSINEDNQFNKFHKLISDMEDLIEESQDTEAGFHGGIEYKDKTPHSRDDKDKLVPIQTNDNQLTKLRESMDGLENSYSQAFLLIIQALYPDVYYTFNDSDSNVLFKKLENLYFRIAITCYPGNQYANKFLELCIKNIEKNLKTYNKYKYSKGREGTADKIIETIENFRKQFLS